jgi:hypothetical protein
MWPNFLHLQRWAAAVALLMLAQQAVADIVFRNFEDPDAPQWEEEAVAIPGFPQDANLREFYVSATTTNRFFVDAESLSIGKDGVVRYVLVVKTGSGATNVSFEGIRCDTYELKVYASGRPDGNWSLARGSKWRPISNRQVNRHHLALAKELFCPFGSPIRSSAEGLEALRLGRHPSVP